MSVTDEDATKKPSATATAEELKEQGNTAFASQDFPQAIEHYTAAIELDPRNHVFFSNRSASYAGLGKWKEAVDDAKECIRLNPQFMKGYYRLATAQLELEEFDLAQATIKQGLALDANNSQLLKVLRTIKQQRKKKAGTVLSTTSGASSTTTSTATATASSSMMAPSSQGATLDPATSREFYDLQLQHSQTSKEYQLAQANLQKLDRETKVQQVTQEEITQLNRADVSYYRTIGKMFVKSSRERVLEHLSTSIQEHSKKQVDLTQKCDYLERRLTSQRQNMEELLASSKKD